MLLYFDFTNSLDVKQSLLIFFIHKNKIWITPFCVASIESSFILAMFLYLDTTNGLDVK